MTSAVPETTRGPSRGRLRSLDGLRGVAALVVVFQHTLLSWPSVADVFFEDTTVGVGTAYWWLTYTPLHLFWVGEEAVLVFFVLSGLVLALPATRRAVSWWSYFPKRLARLYVPVWAALVVAVALAGVVPRQASPGQSSWLNARADVPLSGAWSDALLVGGVGLLNSPLWSLRWEVVFSLLLPVYLLLASRYTKALPVKLAGLLGLIAVGTLLGSQALRFLPMFAFGVLMAYHLEELSAIGRRIDAAARPALAWWSLGALAVLLLTARWTADGLPVESALLEAAGSGGSFLGAVLVVFLAMYWPSARNVLLTGPVQYLGLRSFSLYLIHEPVVVSTLFLLPEATPRGATFLICVGLSLLAAAGFYQIVEAPSHRLAQRAGRAGVSLRGRSKPVARAAAAGQRPDAR